MSVPCRAADGRIRLHPVRPSVRLRILLRRDRGGVRGQQMDERGECVRRQRPVIGRGAVAYFGGGPPAGGSPLKVSHAGVWLFSAAGWFQR
jgi:hypothetical protein